MEEYLGIYNNSSTCAITSYNLDLDSDCNNLHDSEFEFKNTIEELEKKETQSKFLHIYQKQLDEYDITTYKYITTKIIK